MRAGAVPLLVAAAACSLDPVHDDAVRDLGGETPGVPPGPDHRPGQPCLVCHDGSTASPAMAVGGTVYAVLGGTTPLPGAQVTVTDAAGSSQTATTNAVGNFYVESSAWQPRFPLGVVVEFGGIRAPMSTIVGRDGSCAACHAAPPSRISAGPVYLVPSASLLPDAGAP